MPFITVDAVSEYQNSTRPAYVNVDAIAFVTASGELYNANNNAAIVFAGGGFGAPKERLVVKQAAAQVKALIDAALA